MQIVDLQIHLWENARMSPQHRQIPTYNVDDALKEMAEAGVDAAVIHPPSTLGEGPNAQAVEAVKAHPDKFCILGNFDLQAPNREEIVKNWRQRPGMLGFRFTFNQPHQQSWWSDGSLDWFWAACEREKLPVGLMAGGHLADLARIAERHPGLKLHIDHHGRGGGGGSGTDDAAFANLGDMLALGQISERRGQIVGRAELFERALSLSQHPQIHPPDRRRVRPAALLLGHRHHPHAVLVPAMRDDVHRGTAVAPGPRQGSGHGRRGLRLARLETPGLIERRRSLVGSIFPSPPPAGGEGRVRGPGMQSRGGAHLTLPSRRAMGPLPLPSKGRRRQECAARPFAQSMPIGYAGDRQTAFRTLLALA